MNGLVALCLVYQHNISMTFILIDRATDSNDLQIANRVWRPIAAEIARSNLIDSKRSETIAFHLCTKVNDAEAKRISRHLFLLLKNDTLPDTIDPVAARQVADFAGSSQGFEVC